MSSFEKRSPLAPGEVRYTIKNVYTDKKSGEPLIDREGYPMYCLQLQLINPQGEQGISYEYLTRNIHWKMDQLAESLNVPIKNQDGKFDFHSLIGKGGRCSIKIDSHETYGDRNKVNQFLPCWPAKVNSELHVTELNQQLQQQYHLAQQASQDEDDEIPF